MWQVTIDPHKTRFLDVTWTNAALRLKFKGEMLTPRDEVEVLGVTYARALTFKSHVERLARQASGKLAVLRRMASLLDSRGMEILYKAQFRSSLEYSCLAWGETANKHLTLLDKVQDRSARLIKDCCNGPTPPHTSTSTRRRGNQCAVQGVGAASESSGDTVTAAPQSPGHHKEGDKGSR